ncbi:MAG: hypothetical protein KBD14_00005 [Candidatus Pacebacteria bacterium]|nr:hypothetical protein [Candidatus Paceibacterota bacterium]
MEFKQPIVERHKINETSKEILATNFSNISEEKYFSLVMNKMYVQQPVMYEEELSKLFEHFATQLSNEEEMFIKNEINSALLHYVSNNREIDKKTKQTTLDRAYIEFYRIAEKYPEEMFEVTKGTNPLEEYVSPDVFFDQYLKIRDSKILNKYFGGKQFSQLEYNMTYEGTEKYLESLLNKINFKNSDSCLASSQLMNLSASLADYANNGSYSGNYDIGGKIISSLKSRSNDPESIYLLGSKANYIIERLEKGWPPFVHKNKIFEIAPNILGVSSENDFLILSTKDNSILEQYKVYKSLSSKLNKPPQHLIDLAIKNGQDFVRWEPDKGLMLEKDMIEEDLKSETLLTPQLGHLTF